MQFARDCLRPIGDGTEKHVHVRHREHIREMSTEYISIQHAREYEEDVEQGREEGENRGSEG